MADIFASTTCLKGDKSKFTKNLAKVITTYNNSGINNIEIGSVHEYKKDYYSILSKFKQDNNFIIHTFFPPTKKQIMINPAGTKKEEALKIGKNAIDICRKIDSDLYTIHGGASVDFDDDMNFSNPQDRDVAVNNAIETLQNLNDYGNQNGVRVGIETSLAKGDKFLFTDQRDYDLLFKNCNKNMGVLIDVAHFCVSSDIIGFDKRKFVDRFQNRIFEFHCHDPERGKDKHKLFANTNIFKEIGVSKTIANRAHFTLESIELRIQKILEGMNNIKTGIDILE